MLQHYTVLTETVRAIDSLSCGNLRISETQNLCAEKMEKIKHDAPMPSCS